MYLPPLHVTIGDIWIDVSVREGHDLSAEVTEHPVESGASVADHIRPLPPIIEIEGMVTNHPIELPGSHVEGARVNPAPLEIEGERSLGFAGVIPGADQANAILGVINLDLRSRRTFSATPLRFTTPFNRVEGVYQALREIVTSRTLVTVVTRLQVYDSVALTNLRTDRTGALGRDVLEFHATGRVLRVVNSQQVKLPRPVSPRGLPTKSAGNQATVAVTT